jgi:hypothetical protein
MGLQNILSGNWFTRIVLIAWIICAVSVYFLFKNMELIVHGQLYSYGLLASPDWMDPYRILTWLIYISLGVPTALSSIALVSSFFKAEKVLEKQVTVPQRTTRPPQGNVKMEPPRPTVREAPQKAGTGNGNAVGISCPKCKKVFGRSLVMLDFRSGKNRMVSVCPYCNHVLGYTNEEKGTNEKIYVANPEEKKVY